MTAHEVFTALFWIVAGAYVTYLGWFIATSVQARRSGGPAGEHHSGRDTTSPPQGT